MDSSLSKVNRIPLVCIKCFKSCVQLPLHLSRVCMKGSTPEEIRKVVKEVRSSMIDHLEKRRIYNSENLKLFPVTSEEEMDTEHQREEEEEEGDDKESGLYEPPSGKLWQTSIPKKSSTSSNSWKM
ncbi:hypothetical protein NDU88_004068 [Pleurodeles waltl]|uniref:Uncharacterized protein n=1 Tax=Pleurodeles waltl TaxID=8319 RepID=A0AAV7W3Y1_PLEWA|nr:hypothetical protein NDU88_004068 [Pleurodeles waltl]